MRGAAAPLIVGITVTLVVHGALAASYATWTANYEGVAPGVSSDGAATQEFSTLCEGLRCARTERRQRRRAPEPPPVDELDVLEASMIPALGMKQQDPRKLPEITTYQQPEVVEDGVNLDKDPALNNLLKKDFVPRDAKRDPRSKQPSLDQIIKEQDPRARARDLENIIGSSDGEIGGQGSEKRLGSAYSARASRAIRKAFKTPPFIDSASLKELKARIVVQKIGLDGAILSYRVTRASTNRSYDEAALAAVKQFVPSEGGSRRLPPPDPDVLRYINQKGMAITFDGRYAQR